MKASASIELLWQMAVQEALAGEFGEIQPEHFFAGLMKFAELPEEQTKKLAPGANVAQELATEVGKVRLMLQNHSIDSTRVRRELRARLGKGGRPNAGGTEMHRSQACREMFDAASRLADDKGSDVLAAEHILAAMLASPTEPLRAVLGASPAPPAAQRTETPLLDRDGRDLVRLAANGELEAGMERKAESRNLVSLLADAKHLSVLMVTGNDPAARSVVAAAARSIASEEPAAALKGKRLIDVTAVITGQSKAESVKHLEKLLNEAAVSKDVIVWGPPIETSAGDKEPGPLAELLKKSVSAGSLQCICRVSPTAYERWIQKDRDWGRHAHVMWIAESIPREIPREL